MYFICSNTSDEDETYKKDFPAIVFQVDFEDNEYPSTLIMNYTQRLI